MRQAHYFPVDDKPFAMRAGLLKFPTDFGNGARDAQVFQVDEGVTAARAAKRAPRSIGRYFVSAEGDEERAAIDAAYRLAREHLLRDAPECVQCADHDGDARDPFDALARSVQEDLAVVHQGQGEGKTVLLHVSFPSGWPPEKLAGASFAGLHEPVPGFPGNDPAKSAAAAASMVRSMVERGPYVRFVWTVRADDALDHHPEVGARQAWRAGCRGFLRVERQLTWPLPEARASLFVIRTYLTPFAALSATERATLATALRTLPPALRAYKGLPDDPQLTLDALHG